MPIGPVIIFAKKAGITIVTTLHDLQRRVGYAINGVRPDLLKRIVWRAFVCEQDKLSAAAREQATAEP